MIETLLALVPDFGLWVVSLAVFAACLAVPVPASMMVLTAGSFAAFGDLSLAAVLITVFLTFVAGDFTTFTISRSLGGALLDRLRRIESVVPTLDRSEKLLKKNGQTAVLLSHTILSPTCPYVSVLCGSGRLGVGHFAAAAIPGAAIWTLGYVMLGYTFADQLEQVASLVSNFLGIILISSVIVGSGLLLRHRWRQHAFEHRHAKT
ncbi:MAG: VTT domain-containing protein [Boseongicola sp.]|nr:VTT domain-containing protein [Boseongicola sp.]MDD9977955.1 VTT domain-containing protein [Boseongicola sp.]